jgi:type IV pilus assembly protein PilF
MKRWQLILSASLLTMLVGCSATTETNSLQAKNSNQRVAEINVQLGVGYLQQNDMPRAKQKLLTALNRAPNWPPVLEAMAYFYQVTGDTERAEEYYTKALKIAPKAGSTLNNYGAFLCKQGNYRKSLAYFELALQDEKYLKTAEVYENAGLCAAKLPDYKLAMRYLQKSLQQNPSRIQPLLDQADIAYKQGQYREALGYLNLYASQTDLPEYYVTMRRNLRQKIGE